VSVVNAAHEHVVSLIKKAGDTLVLKVIHAQPPPPPHLDAAATGLYHRRRRSIRAILFLSSLFTDRVSGQGNAIDRVRLSVCFRTS